ncbi:MULTISPECIES: YibE/F family protein [Turicibacter]|uniref:YibE/F family protein n=1 Tax=Turicibacter TaxID=191303 RepID=UPI0006BEBFA4|nr:MULTISPECIES: YibE/F family protein [Turicibacter]MCU7193289.1 YibE/F family protein [Turicibacter sp. T129]MDY4815705.1 YibE/F family protein [Turicibacter bilis]CUN48147.1 YibE/F-like protein [Turicibacter sanguinis]
MTWLKNKINRKECVMIGVFIVLLALLWWIPTGFQKQIYVNSEGVKAKVVEVNNKGVYSTGMIQQGDQRCTIEILEGEHKGQQVEGMNLLTGKLEFDKMFKPGDEAWVLLELDSSNEVIFANMVDYYRIDQQIFLIGLFVILIIAFSGFTGVRTLLSFSFALFSIVKILIPCLLKGIPPLLVALMVGNLLTVITLLLVAGCNKKAYTAIISSMICSLMTCLLAVVFGDLFKMHGAVMDWSESLLYAGYQHLDLTAIFQAGIYLACSGAILDLSIDISAALDEVIKNNPSVSRANLIKSGLSIGKSVVGSQTTTLLLAYMGSYITILMVYMAQGTPLMSILNSQKVSSEILHTFVGCIGLVLVSPLTAIICGIVYCPRHHREAAIETSPLIPEN